MGLKAILSSIVLQAILAAATPALAAGLPQLDPSRFAPQIIWLAITFGFLYVLMSRVALPRISQVLEERQDRIDGNLERAEALKNEAQEIMEAYEKALAEARAEARDVLRQAAEQMAGEAAERHAALSVRLERDVSTAEARVNEAREIAVANIRELALEVARAATERLAGEKVDEGTLDKAVDATLKERG